MTGAMPYKAGAAASRSPASHRDQARTRQDGCPAEPPASGRLRQHGRECSRLAPPDDDAAAEAQPLHPDPAQARGVPPRELAIKRVALPEVADRPPEETADLR